MKNQVTKLVSKDKTEFFKGQLLHNLNGPAVVRSNGHNEYWIDGMHQTPEAFVVNSKIYLESKCEEFSRNS